ncbi:MAG: hypothetical protein QXQ02_07300 [Halobacteria archaeon]
MCRICITLHYFYNGRVDLKEIEGTIHLPICPSLIRAIAYVIRADKRRTAFEALLKICYEVKAKVLQVFYEAPKKTTSMLFQRRGFHPSCGEADECIDLDSNQEIFICGLNFLHSEN